MANCVDAVFEKFFKEGMSKEDAKELRADIQGLYDSMSKERAAGFRSGAKNPDAEFIKKAEAALENYQKGVRKLELKRLQNVVKNQKNIEFTRQKEFSGDYEGARARLTGTSKNIVGGTLSADAVNAGRVARLFASVTKGLRDTGIPGVYEIIQSKALDDLIILEKYELASGREGGVTKNAEALAIAKVWQNLTDESLATLNGAGAYINKLEGRVTGRNYNRELMLKEGEEAFKKFMTENLDYDRSFKRDFHTIDAKKAIDDLWKNTTEGRGNWDITDLDQPVKVIGTPANMARKLERARSFHFKSGAAEVEFMRRFGGQSVGEEMRKTIMATARKSTLLDFFGTNPENGYAAWRDSLNLSPAEKVSLDRHWKDLEGSSRIPGKSPWAQRAAGLRKVTDMTSLGNGVFAQIPDFAMRAGEMTMQGENYFSALAKTIGSFFEKTPKSQREEMAHTFGIGAEALISEFYSRHGVTSEGKSLPSIDKLHKMYFKLNLMKPITEINEAAHIQGLASRIGYNADKTFGALQPEYARVLQKYRIGVPEWEVLRSVVKDAEGAKMVGWGDVLEADPKLVWGKLKEAGGVSAEWTGHKSQVAAAESFKRQLADRLSAYYTDRVNIAMSRAGGYERATFMHRGHSEDSVEGQFFRFMTHFKSFSLTTASKFGPHFYHEALAGKSVGQQALNAGQLMATMMALGYVANSLQGIAKGRSPEIPQDVGSAAEIAAKAMAKGGVGGIYGDYILGEFDSRHGRSALSALMGPEIGKIDDVFDLANQIKQAGFREDPSKVKLSAITRFGINNVIGNLPGVRQGLDYMFFNEMAETLNPGYTARMNQRQERLGSRPIAPWGVGYEQ